MVCCTVRRIAVSLANLSVSPNPIVAGGNATIKFQLYNAYESWFYGTTIQPSGSYPMFNVSPLSSNVIGQLGHRAQCHTTIIQFIYPTRRLPESIRSTSQPNISCMRRQEPKRIFINAGQLLCK
jgi:hypothetical protein